MQVRANPGFSHAGPLVPGKGTEAQEQGVRPGNYITLQLGLHSPLRWTPRMRVEAGAQSSTFFFQSPLVVPGQYEQQAGICSSAVSSEVDGRKFLQGWQQRERIGVSMAIVVPSRPVGEKQHSKSFGNNKIDFHIIK